MRALGKIGLQKTENEVILLEHDVPHSQFSEEVLSCLPKLPWTITDDVISIFFTQHFINKKNFRICKNVSIYATLTFVR